MVTQNENDRGKMRLLIPGRSESIDHLIKETEDRLANTMAFLARIEEKEEKTRDYIAAMMNDLESQLARLRSKDSIKED